MKILSVSIFIIAALFVIAGCTPTEPSIPAPSHQPDAMQKDDDAMEKNGDAMTEDKDDVMEEKMDDGVMEKEDGESMMKENDAMMEDKEGAMMEKGDDAMAKGEVKTFNVTSRQWAFEPSTITVSKGDAVKLIINNIDVAHGIAIPAFNVSEHIAPGETVTVEFVADKGGEFPFFCNVFCGSGHKSMKGTLIVK